MIKKSPDTNAILLKQVVLQWVNYPAAEPVRLPDLDALQDWFQQHYTPAELSKESDYLKNKAVMTFSEPEQKDMDVTLVFRLSDKNGGFNPFNQHIRDHFAHLMHENTPHLYQYYRQAMEPRPAAQPSAEYSAEYYENNGFSM